MKMVCPNNKIIIWTMGKHTSSSQESIIKMVVWKLIWTNEQEAN